MAIFQKNGLGPKRPLDPESGQAIPTMQEADADADYGRIDLTTPRAMIYQLFTGHRLKRTRDDKGRVIYERAPEGREEREPRAPPAPPDAAGRFVPYPTGQYIPFSVYSDYIPNRALREVYKGLQRRSLENGHRILHRSREEMFSERGSIGYEHSYPFEGIEVAEDMPLAKRVEVLAHEMRAKRHFKGRERYRGDHEAEHDAIILGTEEDLRRYVSEALIEDAKRRKN